MSAAEASHPLHLMMPRLGTEEEFEAVRRLFGECDYHGEGVFRRLGIPGIEGFKTIRQGRQTLLEPQSALDALIHLFLDGEQLEEGNARSLLPEGALEALGALNLAAPNPDGSGNWFAPVLIFPGFGLLMASDRSTAPYREAGYKLPTDVVYPAVIENTRDFIAALPEIPCEAALDLGTGSGIAALLAASRYAKRAWGSDITARATQFAEFNRRLNSISNAEFVEGDMYAPVEGLSFDRIVTHPPYVPAASTKLIYRDGGDDGEQILRRAIEGLPQFLRPGGRFYAVVMAADCEGETLEERIRKWLGASQDQFDLVLIAHSLRDPATFLSNFAGKSVLSEEEQRYREELWKRRKVQFLFYGRILLRRRAEERPVITARVLRGKGMTMQHVEWLLEWEIAARNPAKLGWLLGLRPAISPASRLLIVHDVVDGRFQPTGAALQCPGPFESECQMEPWVASVVSECDGQRTLQDHFEQARQNGFLAADADAGGFAATLVTLISTGILIFS